MSDKVECADCVIAMLCFGGRLGKTWSVQYDVDDLDESINHGLRLRPNANGDIFLNGDGFHASVCPMCGIMTVYTCATGFEVDVTFDCCLRPVEDIQDMFRTQSRFSGSTLNRSQKNKGAFYMNPETGLEHQVWFIMDDPGPGEHIVAMQCRECKKAFEETVEGLARRVAILKENVTTVANKLHVGLGAPKELQREVNKLAASIGGEFLDVEDEVFVRARDKNTGAPLEKPPDWDEDGEAFEG